MFGPEQCSGNSNLDMFAQCCRILCSVCSIDRAWELLKFGLTDCCFLGTVGVGVGETKSTMDLMENLPVYSCQDSKKACIGV
jgi:hypothetical protein